MPLPEYIEPYWQDILYAAGKHGFDPHLIAAIGDRETKWGTHAACHPKGPACLGDAGHGHGLMQIDDRSFPDFCGNYALWATPVSNILKGCMVLKNKLQFLKNEGVKEDVVLQCAVAAYNCGEGNALRAYRRALGVDYYTSGKDYSADVLRRWEAFRQ